MTKPVVTEDENQVFKQKVNMYLDSMSLNSEDRKDLEVLLNTKIRNQKAVWLDIFLQGLTPKQARAYIEGLVRNK